MKWLYFYRNFKFFVRVSPAFKRAYPSFCKFMFRAIFNKKIDYFTMEVTENVGYEVIGYLITERKDKYEIVIKDMFVAPMYRKQGYATDMIRGMLQIYETEGFIRLSATVSRDNTEIISLLFDLGFEKDIVECNKLLVEYSDKKRNGNIGSERYVMFTPLN